MIIGPSGAGKSSLALQLIALGAVLVADDRTTLTQRDGGWIADAPGTIAGQIEARGVGLLRVPYAGPTPVVLVVDLAQIEADRLPRSHVYEIDGIATPCLHNADSPHFAQAILFYIKGTTGA